MSDTYRFFIMTTDPVHVGTGGMRLGRVDNTIVREPGTNLPKIPGTALHGAIRMYAARRYGKPQCAGQKGHCGQPTCPICYTFGSIEGEAGSFSGVVSIGDARILLFPVYSMVGPVWVTSPTALQDAGLGEYKVSSDKAKWGGNHSELPTNKPLNLGWLMVERDEKENKSENGNFPKIDWPDKIPEQIRNRIVLVSNKLFSQIVNSNLEVRTSVAINPETGAAEEKALYTYEAIPRATILWFDVIVDDFRAQFPNLDNLKKWESTLRCDRKEDNKNKEENQINLLTRWRLWDKDKNEGKFKEALNKACDWVVSEKINKDGQQKWRWLSETMKNIDQSPIGIVQAGLEWAEHLGIGGMGTRGFGRIKKICEPWEV